EILKHTPYTRQSPRVELRVLAETTPQIKVLPSKFNQRHGLAIDRQDRMIGIGVALHDTVQLAYSNSWARIVLPPDLSRRRVDFIANLPSGSRDALRSQIEKQYQIK